MAEELSASSTLIEQSVVALSDHFRDLATATEAQTDRVQRVASIARSIEVAGEQLPMTEATRLAGAALVQGIDALATASAWSGEACMAPMLS